MDENLVKQLVEAISQQKDILASLAEKGITTKAPAATMTATRLHGSTGIFSTPGLERDVISAHVRPFGIGGILPLLPSTSEDPRYAALTGYTAPTGSQPTNACDDAPAGYVKACNLTSRFGRIRYDTQTVEMDKVMLKVNRGDFTDLVLRGKVLGMTENIGPKNVTQDGILDIVTKSEMITVGVLFERELSRQLWQGVATVANELVGLDAQIATGQRDADTGNYCTALDSDVKSYNYQLIGNSLVTYLSQLEWYLYHNAQTMGLLPVNWVLAMRPDLWSELTAVWACAYYTNRCATVVETNSSVTIDGREVTSIRDAMREGMYLDINGRRYPVITDSGIFEHNSSNNPNCAMGEYASSIYMVPMTIIGNMPVTYREFVDYRLAAADTAFLKGMSEYFWTDDGIYSWALEIVKWCYKFAAKTEQRIVLRTPQLAGRIDAVKYAPLQHLRDSDPDSPYHFDGGVSTRPGISTPYAVWSSR